MPRTVIAARPLPTWKAGGKEHHAKLRTESYAPPTPGESETIVFTVGNWHELPPGKAGLEWLRRLRTQSENELAPTMQRFEFDAYEVADEDDTLEKALPAGVQVRRLPKSESALPPGPPPSPVAPVSGLGGSPVSPPSFHPSDDDDGKRHGRKGGR